MQLAMPNILRINARVMELLPKAYYIKSVFFDWWK